MYRDLQERPVRPNWFTPVNAAAEYAVSVTTMRLARVQVSDEVYPPCS